MNVAVIPARGGSERIPRKNIREFCGLPIIAYSIDAARKSDIFDHIIVSTDDDEIAKVARSCGAEAPFRRPAELADAFTGTTEVIAHAAEWMTEQSWPVDCICCIYATAPFVLADDLQIGFEQLKAGNWSFVVTASEYSSSVFRAFRATPEGGLEMFFPGEFNRRSQDLPVALHDAGQFYWGRAAAWLERRPLFDRHSSPLLLSRSRVHDIDTETDWRIAEHMFGDLVASDPAYHRAVVRER